MDKISSPGHAVTVEVKVNADSAFNYLQEPSNIGKWALGSWNTRMTDDPDLFFGTSLFDGEPVYFRIVSNPELKLIDYFVGDRDILQPRISARVIKGQHYGAGDSSCLVTLSAWRDLAMDNDRWHQLCVCHETEILLIKALMERE